MRFTSFVTAGALALLPAGANAQVSGAIIIGGGPVGGVVTIGQPVIVHPPRERVVVVERYPPPRVIVVDHWKRHKHHPRHFVRRVVYWDRRYDRFYEHSRPGLIQVGVYYGNGRYYYDHDWYRDRYRYRRYDDDHSRRHGDWDDRYDRDRDWDRDRDRDWDRDGEDGRYDGGRARPRDR